MLSDEGSTPSASTTEDTSQLGLLGAGLSNKTACSLRYPEEDLLKLIGSIKRRDDIKKYIIQNVLIAKYLPHITKSGETNRLGKFYNS